MATTGISGYFDIPSGYFTLRVHYLEYYDIATNDSTIAITGAQIASSYYSYHIYYPKGTISVDGNPVVTFSSALGSHACGVYSTNEFYNIEAASASYPSAPWTSGVIVHNDNGTKIVSISVNFTLYTGNGKGGSGTTFSASQAINLTTIPRKSTLAASNGTLGVEQTLKVTRASSSFTHTITYTCGSLTGTIREKSSSETIPWTPLPEFATCAPNGTSVFVSLTITTYNGDTAIGSNTGSIYCAIPENEVPSVSLTVTDAAGYFNKYGGYVQGKSKLNVSAIAYGRYYSTIRSCVTTIGGVTYTTQEFVTDAIQSSGLVDVSCTVTDSRNRTGTDVEQIAVLPYSAPKITGINVYRSDVNGNASSSGTYLAVVFSADVTPLNNVNTASYAVSYKKNTEPNTAYITKDVAAAAGVHSVTNAVYVFEADPTASYDVIVNATDDFSSTPRHVIGGSMFKLLSIHKSGTGLAVGKMVESAIMLDVGLPATFQNAMYMKNNQNFYLQKANGTDYRQLFSMNTDDNIVIGYDGYEFADSSTHVCGNAVRLYAKEGVQIDIGDGNDAQWMTDHVVAQGTSGIWTYRKWRSGIAECWCRTNPATVNVTVAWGTLYTNDTAIAPVALPFTFTSVPRTIATPIRDASNYNYWLITSDPGTTTTTPSYGAIRASSYDGIIVAADLYVVGRWK